MQRKIGRRAFVGTTLGTVVAGSGVALYSFQIEPRWIDVHTLQLRLPHLDSAFHGYRIVQLSDLHCDESWMTAERLGEVVRLANEQQPDLVVITGDFVTRYLDSIPQTLAVLRGLRSPDGIFGILGNHDHWTGAELIRPLLQPNGVQELNDQIHTIQRPGGAMLHLAGMDDLWPEADLILPLETHLPRVQKLVSLLPEQGAAILMVHEPDFAEIASRVGRFDLQLSGHSHAGQIRLPFVGPLRVPPLGRKYPDGLYTVGNLLQYTSRGLGMISPQVRLNCRPEMAVIELI